MLWGKLLAKFVRWISCVRRVCWCAAGSTDRWERYQFLRWSRPRWKLLVRTHKSTHFHNAAATSPHGKDTNSYADQGRDGSCWSVRTKTFIFTMKSNLPHNIRNYICRERAECCYRCIMLRLHVCPTNQPCQPSIIRFEWVVVLMPRADSRAEPNSVQCRHRLQILHITSTTQSEGRWIDYDWGWEAPYFILRPHGLYASIVYDNAILTGQESAGEEREVT